MARPLSAHVCNLSKSIRGRIEEFGAREEIAAFSTACNENFAVRQQRRCMARSRNSQIADGYQRIAVRHFYISRAARAAIREDRHGHYQRSPFHYSHHFGFEFKL